MRPTGVLVARRMAFSRAVGRHDLSHPLAVRRIDTCSFPAGADYPTYWVSILAGKII